MLMVTHSRVHHSTLENVIGTERLASDQQHLCHSEDIMAGAGVLRSQMERAFVMKTAMEKKTM